MAARRRPRLHLLTLRQLGDGVTLRFVVTDGKNQVPTFYRGIPPSLFKEGSGVVAEGRFRDDGLFVASEILAKHDENYMPPQLDARKGGE